MGKILSDADWSRVEEIIISSKKKHSGPPRKYGYREILEAILYVNKTGMAWRDLPIEAHPPYRIVHKQYMSWMKRGVFDKILTALRQEYRVLVGKEEEPSCAIVDSKTVQTVFNHSTVGVDGHKKNQGHKKAHSS
jgi:transposase